MFESLRLLPLKVKQLLSIAVICIALILVIGYINKIFFPEKPQHTSHIEECPQTS